jgi:ribosomal protein L9
VDDGDQTVTITHAASSDDSSYDTLNDKGVEVTVTDDDSAGVSLSKSNLAVSEIGSTGTYEVMLTSQPTATVTIAVTSSNVGEATVEPATLTFTASNWDTPQTVTVTGVDDDVDDGDIQVTISHNASSADSAYDSIIIADVTVTVQATQAKPRRRRSPWTYRNRATLPPRRSHRATPPTARRRRSAAPPRQASPSPS